MARYIDADAFEPMLLEEYERATWIEHNTIKMFFEMLSAMPTADVVEVVRCRDCEYADIFHHCDKVDFWNTENDFCSKGKRRTQ